METRKIGQLEVSVAGLGCNNFGMRIDEAATQAVVDAALDAGITLFDTADIYGGGERPRSSSAARSARRRDDVVIATKFGMRVGRRHRRAAEPGVRAGALRGQPAPARHRPHRPLPAAPARRRRRRSRRRSTRSTTLVRAGKVREIGCSNFAARSSTRPRPRRRAERSAAFVERAERVQPAAPPAGAETCSARASATASALLPYFPLASGLLTGKYRRGEAPPEGTRLAAWGRAAATSCSPTSSFDVVERLDDVRPRAGPHAARAGAVVAGRPAGWSPRHRRRDPARAGAGQRGRDVAWTLTDAERAQLEGILA